MALDPHADEQPEKKTDVAAYWIDMYPVTVAQYARFCRAAGHVMPPQPGYSTPRHPVVNVSWAGAAAYADWVGAKLPTEAEYEKAARGGQEGLKYPWGNDWSPAQANGARTRGGATPVCSYPPNGFGLFDMVGNVWEWCQDRYQRLVGTTLVGAGPDWLRVLRGGSWLSAAGNLSVATRNYDLAQGRSSDSDGFRCVQAP
jgi:formylglycine-generating enzyme required for sulfatase activity